MLSSFVSFYFRSKVLRTLPIKEKGNFILIDSQKAVRAEKSAITR